MLLNLKYASFLVQIAFGILLAQAYKVQAALLRFKNNYLYILDHFENLIYDFKYLHNP